MHRSEFIIRVLCSNCGMGYRLDTIDTMESLNWKAEEIRIRYLYRDLVLSRKIRLSFEAARKIVGPDSTYHLYSITEFNESKKLGVLEGQGTSKTKNTKQKEK